MISTRRLNRMRLIGVITVVLLSYLSVCVTLSIDYAYASVADGLLEAICQSVSPYQTLAYYTYNQPFSHSRFALIQWSRIEK
jgi:hypothetical protein